MQERGRDPQELLKQMTPEQQSQLQAKMSQMTPEEQLSFMEQLSANWQQMGGDAKEQMTRADALRRDAPQGRYAGGVYQAANPLEHIASTMNNMKQRDAYDTAQGELGAAREGEQATRQGAIEDFVRSRALRSPV